MQRFLAEEYVDICESVWAHRAPVETEGSTLLFLSLRKQKLFLELPPQQFYGYLCYKNLKQKTWNGPQASKMH